jgi:sarcosine oxidase gamma subunit
VGELAFLSPARARAGDGFAPRLRSPLERALARARPTGVEDISLTTGKLEVRGDLDRLHADVLELIAIAPGRALVLCDYAETTQLRAELTKRAHLVIDLTGALAGLRIRRPDAEGLLRRLTDLDLESLPAVGAVARVRTYLLRDDADAFRLFFPQEYGHYFAEFVADAVEGLER